MSLTNSQITRAGETLRRQRRGEAVTLREYRAAADLLGRFRREWSDPPRPLTKAAMGLRSMVATLGMHAQVSQRLKRRDRIIDKLVRFPSMRLPQMEDIGGCRIVLGGLPEQREFLAHLRSAWASHDPREYDYVSNPKHTGYRAVHVIALWDGRLIETQVRTVLQHRWATTVERLDAVTGHRLKDGKGPEMILDGIRAAADAFARGDAIGKSPDDVLRELRGPLPGHDAEE
jgi:ppGpp synthetase/RelA/SpoT-type nucleotidyltranferase